MREKLKFHVYTCRPVDFWDGLRQEADLPRGEDGRRQPSVRYVTGALAAIRAATEWNGDGDPMFTSLPVPYEGPAWVVVIKHSDNGTTFVASPFELPYLAEDDEYNGAVEVVR